MLNRLVSIVILCVFSLSNIVYAEVDSPSKSNLAPRLRKGRIKAITNLRAVRYNETAAGAIGTASLYTQLRDLVHMDKATLSLQKLARFESYLRQMYPGGLSSVWEYTLRALRQTIDDPASGAILDSLIARQAEQLEWLTK